MKIVIKSFIPAVLAFIVATVLFCLPGEEFPKRDWYDAIFLDKWIHIGLFATMVTLWALPFIPKHQNASALKNIFLRLVVAFILYGIAIEFIQDRFVANRTFGVDDMIADAIGCGVGYFFSSWQLKKQLS